jgi:HlyD family secretion protein
MRAGASLAEHSPEPATNLCAARVWEQDMWKWFLVIFVVLALLCAGSGYFVWQNKEWRKQIESYLPGDKPSEVRIEKVGKGELSKTVSAPGQIEPRTVVKISAQVSARITALPFRENDAVKKGDVIVRLDARDLQAQLDVSKAALKGEEARLEGAQALVQRMELERDRVQRLVGSGDFSKSQLEAAENDYAQAASALRATEHSIERARAEVVRVEKDLENTVISSPLDGTITTLDAEEGELVVVGTLNSPGSVIMEIANLSDMILKARVDESNIVPVKNNQPAKVYINAYGEREFKGTVERVELQRKLDKDATGYFEVWIPIQLEKGETLRSGLTANTDIQVEMLRDVLVVPSQAVVDRKVDDLPKSITQDNPNIQKNNTFAHVVYRLEDVPGKTTSDGKPVRKTVATPVQIGTSDLTRTVVLAGLKEGEQIVTGPFKVLMNLRQDQEVVEEGDAKAIAKPEEKDKKNDKPAEASAADGKQPAGG